MKLKAVWKCFDQRNIFLSPSYIQTMHFMLTSICWIAILMTIEGSGYNLQMTADFCRYKFNVIPLTWQDAQKACLLTNRSLVKVNDTDIMSTIRSLASSIDQSRLPSSLQISSRLWVGLKAIKGAGEVTHIWEDCSVLNAKDEVNNFLSEGLSLPTGCVTLDLSSGKFVVSDCSEVKLPYICETLEAVPCFDEKSSSDLPYLQKHIEIDSNLHSEGCEGHCISYSTILCNAFQYTALHSESNDMHCISYSTVGCMGFQNEDLTCNLLTYVSTSNENRHQRWPAYTLGYLGLDNYSAQIKGFRPSLKKCFPTINPVSTTYIVSTRAPALTATSEYTKETLLSTSADIESSFPSHYTGRDEQTISPQTQHTQQTPSLGPVSETVSTSPIMTDSLRSAASRLSAVSGINNTETLTVTKGVSTRNIAINRTYSINSNGCLCPCSMYNNKTYSPEEVQSRLKEIRGNLKINRKNTTVYKRSLLSATDERISAQSIGYVGVAVLIIISGLIISMDVPRVITWMREFIKNRRDKT